MELWNNLDKKIKKKIIKKNNNNSIIKNKIIFVIHFSNSAKSLER